MVTEAAAATEVVDDGGVVLFGDRPAADHAEPEGAAACGDEDVGELVCDGDVTRSCGSVSSFRSTDGGARKERRMWRSVRECTGEFTMFRFRSRTRFRQRSPRSRRRSEFFPTSAYTLLLVAASSCPERLVRRRRPARGAAEERVTAGSVVVVVLAAQVEAAVALARRSEQAGLCLHGGSGAGGGGD
jgi:hypothetical protein